MRIDCRAAVLVLLGPLAGAAQTGREAALLERIERLEQRVRELEARLGPPPPPPAPAPAPATPDPAAPAAPAVAPGINLLLDGNWNANGPAGNTLNLNQAVLMVEQAPDTAAGRRFGARLDLHFGQATEAQSGNPANEPRPQVWRHIFQAYGTYVAPVGKGLTVDFGKWASAIGMEGNYSKDQMNYSRSLLFSFLPLYHFGVRTSYSFSDRFSAGYWLVNGINQSEDFNRFKSHNFTFTAKPAKTVSWTGNWYFGNENTAGDGRTHLLDTYVSWSATGRLTLCGEFDYAVRRQYARGPAAHLIGGAAYARYQFTPKFALGARGEWISDPGGLMEGVAQRPRETTATADYLLAGGFLVRGEWRRDTGDRLRPAGKERNTATLGLVWWMGPRQGVW